MKTLFLNSIFLILVFLIINFIFFKEPLNNIRELSIEMVNPKETIFLEQEGIDYKDNFYHGNFSSYSKDYFILQQNKKWNLYKNGLLFLEFNNLGYYFFQNDLLYAIKNEGYSLSVFDQNFNQNFTFLSPSLITSFFKKNSYLYIGTNRGDLFVINDKGEQIQNLKSETISSILNIIPIDEQNFAVLHSGSNSFLNFYAMHDNKLFKEHTLFLNENYYSQTRFLIKNNFLALQNNNTIFIINTLDKSLIKQKELKKLLFLQIKNKDFFLFLEEPEHYSIYKLNEKYTLEKELFIPPTSSIEVNLNSIFFNYKKFSYYINIGD